MARLAKEYGFTNVAIEDYPTGQTWQPVVGELWITSPRMEKVYDLHDIPEAVASTNANADIVLLKEVDKGTKRSGNVDVNFSSLEGFIAAKVLVEGLRRAGKDPTREKFVGAMESMSNYELGGFAVRFSPENHNGSQFVDLSMIGRDAKFIR